MIIVIGFQPQLSNDVNCQKYFGDIIAYALNHAYENLQVF